MVRIELTLTFITLTVRIFYKTLNAAQLRLKSPLTNQYFTNGIYRLNLFRHNSYNLLFLLLQNKNPLVVFLL